MEYKTLTQQQMDALNRPLPAEAVTPHPTKKFLSSIKSIYVTERLNEVFGIGRWSIKSEIVENHDKMIIVKAIFTVSEYGIEYECYGGNDNADRGDAYKGATTDALTKIGSWLGIGADVFKGKHDRTAKPITSAPAPAQPEKEKQLKPFKSEYLDNDEKLDKLFKWINNAKAKSPEDFDIIAYVRKTYDISDRNATRLITLYNIHAK